jgi:hypothetical protein
MGGGTSKFDENDWSKADGSLADLADTVDGCPPTEEYQVYELVKKGVNQREFDVLDSRQNLIYTTRAVPGTLAWFDVLGPASCGDYQDLRLRVQVDLSRRTWIVYRYHEPLFAGQKSVETQQPPQSALASPDVQQQQAAKEPQPPPEYKLYKSACVTVSWSRYIAIAARYGPPDFDALLVPDFEDINIGSKHGATQLDDDPEDAFLQQASKIAAKRRLGEKGAAADESSLSTEEPTKTDEPDAASSEDKPSPPHPSSLPGSRSSPTSNNSALSSTTTEEEKAVVPEKATTRMKKYFIAQSQSLLSGSQHKSAAHHESAKSKQQLIYELALEGTIDLDNRQIIQCQEIYNKLIGNHQTAIVDKQHLVKMLLLDRQEHELDEPDVSPDDKDPLVVAAEEEELAKNGKLKNWFGGIVSKKPNTSPKDGPAERQDYKDMAAAKQESGASKRQQSKWSLGYGRKIQDNLKKEIVKRDEEPKPIREAIEMTLESEPLASTERAVSVSRPSDNLLDKEECNNDPEQPYNAVLSSLADNLLDIEEPDNDTPETGEPSEPESADFLEKKESNNDTEQPANGLASPTDNLLDKEEPENDLPEPEQQSSQESTDEPGNESSKSKLDANGASHEQRAGNGEPKAEHSDKEEDADYDKLQDLMGDAPQPLVAYWAWKNSIMTHKMRMHLAKNSDLGLHVVLAILANQVRYERNALAMTV